MPVALRKPSARRPKRDSLGSSCALSADAGAGSPAVGVVAWPEASAEAGRARASRVAERVMQVFMEGPRGGWSGLGGSSAVDPAAQPGLPLLTFGDVLAHVPPGRVAMPLEADGVFRAGKVADLDLQAVVDPFPGKGPVAVVPAQYVALVQQRGLTADVAQPKLSGLRVDGDVVVGVAGVEAGRVAGRRAARPQAPAQYHGGHEHQRPRDEHEGPPHREAERPQDPGEEW